MSLMDWKKSDSGNDPFGQRVSKLGVPIRLETHKQDLAHTKKESR